MMLDDDQGLEEDEEVVMPAIAKEVPDVSEKTQKLHSHTHIPYAPWCESCVKGKAKGDHHRPRERESAERAVQISMPLVESDFLFLTIQDDVPDQMYCVGLCI